MSRLTIVFISLLAMSCGSGPAPRQYLLEPLIDPVNESNPPAISAIALAEVTIPSYASDDRIASRNYESQVIYDENAKWADSPDEAITRVLANRLRYYLEANVIVEPWPRGYKPQARIEVQLDKLIRDVTGGAELSGQIRIISGDGKQMLDVRTFNFVRYADSFDPNAFFIAVSAGVNDISRMAAGALSEHFAKQ